MMGTAYDIGSMGLNGFFDVAAKTAGTTANISGALIAAGVSAQALPVIGNIAGAVAVITGLLARQVSKSKTLNAGYKEVETYRAELQQQSNELDVMVSDATSQKVYLITQAAKVDPGLSGFGDWLKKTLTPQKYYAAKIQTATASIEQLQGDIKQKIGTLEDIRSELVSLGQRLTKGNFDLVLSDEGTMTKILLYGGLTLAGAATIYFVIKLLTS